MSADAVPRDAAMGKATSLAATLDFDGPHPRHFGAPPATSRPFVAGSFNGEVARGASCNCRSVTLIPHCHGTHTESVAHLTREPLSPLDLVPLQPLPGLLLDVTPVPCESSSETADPPPRPGDRLVTAAAIDKAWRAHDEAAPTVLALRTGAQTWTGEAAYLSLEAARLLVARGILHVVLELPSVDRSDDDGRLGAHRVFFGLPPANTALAEARRAQCTVTELARIPASVPAGPCAIQLQLTAWSGDAVPCRPVHYALQTS
jgi:kynurenine formamidase